jgi:hypothetical protein
MKKFLTNETGFDIIDKLTSERALLKLDLRKKFEKCLTKKTAYDIITKLYRASDERIKRVPCKLNNVKQHTKHQIRFFLNLDAFVKRT